MKAGPISPANPPRLHSELQAAVAAMEAGPISPADLR
jgi:hypothetical protein